LNLADRGQGHRRFAVQAETADEDRLPERRQLCREHRHDVDAFFDEQRLQRLDGQRIREHVAPAVRAAGGDDVVQRDVLAEAPVHRA